MRTRGTTRKLASIAAAALLVVGVGLVGGSSASAVDKGAETATTSQSLSGSGPAIAALPGTWTLTTDWGCDGSITGSFSITFNANGTWTTGTYNGRWYQVGDMAVWTFSTVADLSYAGNLSGSWISGIQGYTTAGGITGCFGGSLSGLAAAAKAPAAAGTDLAILGPSHGAR